MSKKPSFVYQFKITLKGIEPPLWRRIQVPEDYTFEWLNYAILEAMNWWNEHYHQFEIVNPKSGRRVFIIPDEPTISDRPRIIGLPSTDCKLISEKKAKISKYFLAAPTEAMYGYNFMAGWYHEVVFEKILPAVPSTRYPKCVGGARHTPPEHVNGPDDYKDFIKILADRHHPKYKENRELLLFDSLIKKGEDYNPEKFHCHIPFKDPDWKRIISGEALGMESVSGGRCGCDFGQKCTKSINPKNLGVMQEFVEYILKSK